MNQPHIVAERFEVIDIIGQGGMGIVYRGRDLTTGQLVAMKLLRNEFVQNDSEAVRRFEQEGEALRKLDHPNIVKVLATVKESTGQYIVMEYVSGGSLSDMLVNSKGMPIKRTVEIALDLADALTRTHRLNILHRDIKPSNVLLAADGTPRLTDFGVAHVKGGTAITQGDRVLGTYAYLSPEACTGTAVDERTDIWSFGVLLYEMLTGQLPYTGLHPGQIILGIMSNPVPDMTKLREDIPPALVNLVKGMLTKELENRIPSIRVVGVELEALMRNSETTTSTTPSPSSRFTLASTPSMAATGQNNLPIQPTPFVGRQEEIAEIVDLLDDPACRLLTLVGPGGIGKTRLSLEVASRKLDQFINGTYFIPLAPVASPDLLVPAIADAIKFSFYGESVDPKVPLLGYLREKTMLLVMDNFEHVVEGAPLLSEILATAPGIKILVSSRENLNLTEEWLHAVSGMLTPESADAENIETFSAVQLFNQSARRARPDFVFADNKDCVIRICQLVEGMPLALELAAAWLRRMNCAEIASEVERSLDFLSTTVRNVQERHRSLRAVFEYSWVLLTEAEQKVLARLSIFRGSFSRAAAERVAETTVATLNALVDKSLLRTDMAGRFQVHELVRQYAALKLADMPSDRQQARDLHSTYYAEFLKQQEDQLRSRGQRQALQAIKDELENIRTAWQWMVQQRRVADLDKALDAYFLFYEILSRFQEGESAFGYVVAHLENAHDEAELGIFARALGRQAWHHFFLSRYEVAHDLSGIALGVARELDDKKEIGFNLHSQGVIHYAMREYQYGLAYHEEGLAIRREIKDRYGVARSLGSLGILEIALGSLDSARQNLQESLVIFQGNGDQWSIAFTLQYLGRVFDIQKAYREAKGLYQSSLTIYREYGSQWGIAKSYNSLGLVAREMGEFADASRYLRESLKIYTEIGHQRGQMLSLLALGDTALDLEAFAEAQRYFQQALKAGYDSTTPFITLRALVGEASLLARIGQTRSAVEILAFTLAQPHADREIKEAAASVLARLEGDLPPEVAALALAHGKQMDLETVAANVLADRETT